MGSKITFVFNSSGSWHQLVETSGSVVAYEWQLAAVTFTNQGTARLYNNGIETTSGNFVFDLEINSESLQIGVEPQGTQRYFNGNMALLRIYNEELTSAQIQAIYDTERYLFGL